MRSILGVHWKEWCWSWNSNSLELTLVKSWLIGKDPDSGKDWGQEEKGMIEDEMVGWHHQLDGHEFEQTSGNSEGQRSLVCCSPWGHKELDLTKWLKNSNTPIINVFCVIMELQDTWNKITKFKERNRQFLNVLGYFNTFIWAVDRITRQNIS